MTVPGDLPCSDVMVGGVVSPPCIIIKGIVSNEGITQGDNLAMFFYALGTATLLNHLLVPSPNVKNVCLADGHNRCWNISDFKK